MSLWNRKSSSEGLDGVVRYERVASARHREAVAILMTGTPNESDPAVDHFLNSMANLRGSIDDLWIAVRNDQILFATAILPSAGHVGMVFLSPMTSSSDTHISGELIRAAAHSSPANGAKLLQAILDPWQMSERNALANAGFKSLSNLVYMQLSPLKDNFASLVVSPGVNIERFSKASRPRFEAAILASYQDTKDCPSLVGLRTIDDIIAGHQSAGEHHPDLWFALSKGPDPVGVMLLSMLPSGRAAEVVYLGLSPAWRGRGLGRRLMEHGISEVARRGARTLLLAVDDQNPAALRLYESMHFSSYGRKHAMIMALA